MSEPRMVKVSAKCARLPFHGCDPTYIATVCHGACCRSSSAPGGTLVTIHPSERAAIEARGAEVTDAGMIVPVRKRCPFQTEQDLCGLHATADKPFGCIASPFTLNRSGTLIVRHRYIVLRCYNDGPAPMPAYLAFAASLRLIFGPEVAEEITAHLDLGGGDREWPMAAEIYDRLADNDKAKHQALGR